MHLHIPSQRHRIVTFIWITPPQQLMARRWHIQKIFETRNFFQPDYPNLFREDSDSITNQDHKIATTEFSFSETRSSDDGLLYQSL